jgi:hypothetical protein
VKSEKAGSWQFFSSYVPLPSAERFFSERKNKEVDGWGFWGFKGWGNGYVYDVVGDLERSLIVLPES